MNQLHHSIIGTPGFVGQAENQAFYAQQAMARPPSDIRPDGIANEMEQAQQEICQLRAALSELAKKLEPAMRSMSPGNQATPDAPKPVPCCEIASGIAVIRSSIKECAFISGEIYHRLAL